VELSGPILRVTDDLPAIIHVVSYSVAAAESSDVANRRLSRNWVGKRQDGNRRYYGECRETPEATRRFQSPPQDARASSYEYLLALVSIEDWLPAIPSRLHALGPFVVCQSAIPYEPGNR